MILVYQQISADQIAVPRDVLNELAVLSQTLCVTHNPGVLNDLLQWQPLSWILNQQLHTKRIACLQAGR